MDEAEREVFAGALRRVAAVDDEMLGQLTRLLVHRELKAKEHFIRAGAHATHGGVILEGVLREYFEPSEAAAGKERTRWFGAEGDLLGSLSDLLSDEPSRVSIQALTPARVVVLPFGELARLFEESLAWSHFGRLLTQSRYLARVEREYELLGLSAEGRYERFRAQFPRLEERISQRFVASYLGISPEHLSRLRSRRQP